MYQVTDEGLCDLLLSLFQNGRNVTLLVSDMIVSRTDYYRAQVSSTHTQTHTHTEGSIYCVRGGGGGVSFPTPASSAILEDVVDLQQRPADNLRAACGLL